MTTNRRVTICAVLGCKKRAIALDAHGRPFCKTHLASADKPTMYIYRAAIAKAQAAREKP